MKTVFFPALFSFVLFAACEPDYVRSGDWDRFFLVELTNVSDSDMTADLYTRTDRRADNIEEVKASRYEGRLTIERKQTVRLPLYVTVARITSPIGYCKFVSVVFHAETKEDLFAYICVNSEKSFSVGDRILSYVVGDEYPAESYSTELLFHTVFEESEIVPTDERPPLFIRCGGGSSRSRLEILRLSLKNASEVCQ